MIFQSCLLGNLASLCMKIINSVVVVGLYYGFLTTFSTGPSYLFLLRALVMEEGEEGTEKKVSATTGFIMGQLMMFISIYYTPLHLALGRPHTITVLALPYLLFHFFWDNHKQFFDYGSTSKNSMRNLSIQCVFLNNLIFQLFNHFFLPSSTLTRSVNIYMFRCNNKMLFVTSSFVGWLIGHILFMKRVGLVLGWIQKYYSIRSNKYIKPNRYFVLELRNYMARIFSILLFITCVYYLGRMPSPIFTKKLKETSETKESEEETDVEIEKTSETKETKQEERGFTEEDPSPSLFSEEKEKEACYKNSPTSYSGNQDISKLEILEEENEKPFWFEKPLPYLLFDYNRWNRPMRYIKNTRFENAVRNEMSQYFFYTCQTDGKQRISFSYPPSLAIFWEMIQRNLSLSTTEKFFSDELYNYWIYTNEQKKNSLSNEFSNRIAVLDKGLSSINVVEKKTRLCNDKIKKEYLPKIYDPFLNGSYRGLIKKLFSPSIINETAIKNRIDGIWINKMHNILGNDYNYHEFEEKDVIRTDSLTETIPKKAIGIKEISKKVPRWSYKLIDQYDQEKLEREAGTSPTHQIISRIPKRVVILTDKQEKKKNDDTAYPNTKDTKNKKVDEEDIEKIAVIYYLQKSDFDRELIQGSRRVQRRKTGIWKLFQTKIHSPLFVDRIKFLLFILVDDLFVLVDNLSELIKRVFISCMGKTRESKISDYTNSNSSCLSSSVISDTEIEEEENEEEENEEEENEEEENEKEAGEEARLETAATWERFENAQAIRGLLLVTQSFLRKSIILPVLIIAKNIGRLLLLQRPEWSEDFNELNREMHVNCAYNGSLLAETKFPEDWLEEGIQIKIRFPFRLKPWHRSRIQPDQLTTKDDSCFLTVFGLETNYPFGSPRKVPSFFQPIFKELKKRISKFRKKFRKEFRKEFRKNKFIKKFRKNYFWVLRIIKEKQKLFRKVRNEIKKVPNEIKKENNSMSNNQMIHESSTEAQFGNLTNYSLTQKRMNDLANRRRIIRNQIDKISKDKKKESVTVNISPNKTHYGVKRLESSKNFGQILKRGNARLIRKSISFLNFFFREKIYVDLFLYIMNIPRIYTQLFLESTKNIFEKFIYNNETNQKRIDRTNKKKIQFISTLKTSLLWFNSDINKNSRNHSDFSFLSQAYVFYKLSQAQLINNLYKLRSVFQYQGTSLFLKNEIKDYFGAQGITHSELKTNKLPNSGMNQWKNLLKNNNQYDLSHKKWTRLVPQKWRNRIHKYCRGENQKFKKKKWNSYKKEQLINSNYQNPNNSEVHLLLLPDEKENFKKNYRYDVLSYKFLFYEDKKDSYRHSYRAPFQLNKNQEFSYTYNYNIHKDKLIDMWWSIPITNYLGINNIMDIEINMDRKYFDWKILHFCLRKKRDIGTWVDISTSSNKNTKTEPNKYKYQIVEKMEEKKDIFYRTIDQKLNRPQQKKNLFDWMGMNEEILSRPISNLEFWFFPELFLLYNTYKKKPWAIPMNLLFSNFNRSENFSENQNQDEKEALLRSENLSENKNQNQDQKEALLRSENLSENKNQNQDQKESVGEEDQRLNVEENSKSVLANQDKAIQEDYMTPDIKKLRKQKKAETEFDLLLKNFLVFQVTKWNDNTDKIFNNIDVYSVLLKSIKQKRYIITLSSVTRGEMSLDLMMIDHNLPVKELLTKGILIIEPIRLSIKNDGQFILYQTISISLVHKSKHQNNQKRYNENVATNNLNESVPRHQTMKKNRKKNNYGLLVPENILSPRRRRELRILTCFNSKNKKGVDKNPVFCNGNGVKNCSQFFSESKDLDREKNKLQKFKFFLWPNYRLEDLACMNRYWFDTNNGSRFSLLRIHMYPRLKTNL
uniref:Translocon at the inner envelope membrane of chloroplasts 214 n=1 Tax=Anacampseros filamentosa TaxID=1038461 RepID=A0A411K1Z6_9CARY|nr:hypothetical protein RF1 [Anacampseros filamentosa]